MIYVPLERIQDSPFQARQYYDEDAISELADEIERDGMLQVPAGRVMIGELAMTAHAQYGQSSDGPLTMGEKQFVQLAYGHRRLRAWRLIWNRRASGVELLDAGAGVPGLAGVPEGCMPVELVPLTDEQMFARGVAENRHREDLSAVEEAEAMQVAADTFGWTHEDVAKRFSYDRSTVTNKLRLLRLPEFVRQFNREGELVESKARALVALVDAWEEHPEAAHALREEVASVSDALAYAIDAESAKDVRQLVSGAVKMITDEVVRRKREREPEMFEPTQDETPASKPAEETVLDAVRYRYAGVGGADIEVQPLEVFEHMGHVFAVVSARSRASLVTGEYVAIHVTTGLATSKAWPTQAQARLGAETIVSKAGQEALDAAAVRNALEKPDALSEPPVDVPAKNTSASIRADELADFEDDGGEALRAVAEANGMEPFASSEEREAGEVLRQEAAGELATEEEDDTLKADAWPAPVLPPEWDQIDRMTIAQLEDLRGQYRLHHYGWFSIGGWTTGQDSRKPAQRTRTREVLQQVANLRAAVQLTDPQLDQVVALLDQSGDHSLRELAPMTDEAWQAHRRVMVLPQLVERYDEIVRAVEREPGVPDGLNQQERKLYRLIRDADPIIYHPRKSDELAAEHLAELEYVVPQQGGGYVLADLEDVTESDELDEASPNVSADTPGDGDPWRYWCRQCQAEYSTPVEAGDCQADCGGISDLVHEGSYPAPALEVAAS